MMTEFDLIEVIRRECKSLPSNNFEGIGDDCAVLPIGGGEVLVYTADLLVEQIHFLRQAATPEEVAHKALHVNLSDVASMGLKPVATLLSLALPRETMQGEWAKRFMQGYIRASEQAEVALVGGDTTASDRDIVINVTAIGRGPAEHVKRRRDAQIGDIICVGGKLGASGVGLREILAGNYHSSLAQVHKLPLAQIREGVWLGAKSEVHAMMDLSDGLAGDIRHLLKASNVGAEVELSQIPVAQGADLETALCGGEEYKLLFTVAADEFEELAASYRNHFGSPIYPIGRITDPHPTTLQWLHHGKPQGDHWQGFRHY